MPKIKFLSGPPGLNVGPCIQPFGDSREFVIRMVRALAQFYDETELFCSGPAAAIATVGFNGFFDKGVQEFIQPVVKIADDEDLPAPLGKLTDMFLFSESLLHWVLPVDTQFDSGGVSVKL